MKRKTNRIVTIILIACFTFKSQMVLATGTSGLENQIDKNNQAIKNLENEKNKVKNQAKNATKELDSISELVDAKNAELSESDKKVQGFQVKIDELQSQIDVIQKDIDGIEAEMNEKQKQIDTKESEAKEREEILGTRVRSYYKNDMTAQIISLIINSDGFGDLVSNVYNVSKLLKTDRNLLDDLNKLKERLSKDKELLEEKKSELDEEKSSIKNKQQEIIDAQKEFVDEKNRFLAQFNELKGLEDRKQGIINSLSEKERKLQEQIGDLYDFNAELQAEIDKIFDNINNGNNGGGDVSVGETFLRPTNGYVSSKYGPRTHPISGQSGFHTGVDLASPKNTQIKASKTGHVVYSGWLGGYGQAVIVDHGGGIQTLYGHCETLLVRKGQNVSRGQVIALVGSTGNSTGPHLHFEVRVNGKHTNPMNYIK